MEYFSVGVIILSSVFIEIMYRKMNKVLDEHLKTLEDLDLALRRENYLLKTMNDSLNVVDMAGFISQRMRNAPKDFEAKTDEEVNIDNIRG